MQYHETALITTSKSLGTDHQKSYGGGGGGGGIFGPEEFFFSLSNTPNVNMADVSAGPGLGARKCS